MLKWKKKEPRISSVKECVEKGCDMKVSELTELDKKTDPKPYLKGLHEAVQIIKNAVAAGKVIYIVGDYDCDGIMSTMIMERAVKAYGAVVDAHRIPGRTNPNEGYGMKEIHVREEYDRLESEGKTPADCLLITVDNGIAAFDAIKLAKELGFQNLVTDHHLPAVDDDGNVMLPEADWIVDPKAIPGSEFTEYAGAGICYRIATELIPDQTRVLQELLACASIATVADCMKIIGWNRWCVIKGLDYVNHDIVPRGLRVIMNNLSKEHYTEDDYGFTLGPIMNASGRLMDSGPEDILKILLWDGESEKPSVIDKLAIEVIGRNKTRQDLSDSCEKDGVDVVERDGLGDDYVIIIILPNCPEGLVGIIAGRIAELYRRPAMVATTTGTPGIVKASGRTFGDINLKAMLDYASDLLAGYGGHAGAAGLSFPEENLQALRDRCAEYVKSSGIDLDADKDVSYYDLETSVEDIPDALAELDKYAPYGEGNPRPVFLIKDFQCVPNGGDFVRFIGKDGVHVRLNGQGVNAIGFGMSDEYRNIGSPKTLDILGNLSYNYFRGEAIPQIEIVEMRAKEPVNDKTDLYKQLEDTMVFV